MASSILTGDRRWASARKSGLTVLGKVPKPINLPSQRLENNGVDPSVEIVPKGTLTWGQRPTPATPNAWNSSTLLSPKTDGSAGSPSHGSSRPSSGGGVRPSTAGSDKSQDSPFNAWGSNSRPSSASGLFPSSQTPMVTRPQSSETRPGSSHLSRFAENTAEPTVAWGATRTVEKLMTPSSKNDDFNLKPNDFPTLGSEKTSEINLQRGHTSQVRPGSASGPDEHPKEALERPMSGQGYVGAFPNYGNTSSSRTEKNLHAENHGQSIRKYQNEQHQAPPHSSISVASGHFEPWRCAPVHHIDGISYRGETGGPPRLVGPAASYPVDPFGHYPPHFTPTSESVPRPGAGNVGYRPTNGELYRPQLHPNSYVIAGHAVIPGRPGNHQGPVSYDGYYNRNEGNFGSPGEQQFPFIGMVSQPVLYNQYNNMKPNPNSVQFQNKLVAHDSQLSKEPMISEKAHSSHQSQYKVLIRQNDGWDDNPSPVEKDRNVPSHLNGKQITGGSKLESELPMDVEKNEAKESLKLETHHQISMPTIDHQERLSNITANCEENYSKISDGILSKPDSTIPLLGDLPQHSTVKKNTSLIEKIEGLNNKARGVDGRSKAGQLPVRQEKSRQRKFPDAKVNYSGVISSENAPISDKPVPFSIGLGSSSISDRPKPSDNVTAWRGPSEPQVTGSNAEVLKPAEGRYQHTKRISHSASGTDNANLASEGQVNDNETVTERNLMSTNKTDAKSGLTDGLSDSQSSKELYVASVPASSSSSESLDHKAQRAKLKEIAAQRAKQLQKEEEELTREQKAKALAKLEELNRRSAAQNFKQNPIDSSSIPTDNAQQREIAAQCAKQLQKEEEEHTREQKAKTLAKLEELNRRSAVQNFKQNPNDSSSIPTDNALQREVVEVVTSVKTNAITIDASTSIVNPIQIKQETDDGIRNHRESVVLTATEPTSQEFESLHDSTLSSIRNRNATEIASGANGSGLRSHDNTVNKHKQQAGYRRRQKVSQDKNAGETIRTEKSEMPNKLTDFLLERSPDDKPISPDSIINLKNHTEDTVAALNRELSAHNVDPYVQHKKKNNRNSKNKNKIDEVFVGSILLTPAQYTENLKKPRNVSPETDHVFSAAEFTLTSIEGSVATCENQVSRDVSVAFTEEGSAIANQEAHGRLNSHWKPQAPRRSSRYQQGVRAADKFHGGENVIWAPVKVKNEQSEEEDSHISLTVSKPQSSLRIEDTNSTRLRRAEIERYIPKPVAKELAQQEKPRQPAPSIHHSFGDDEKSRLDSTKSEMRGLNSSVVNIVDAKTVDDSKPNRRSRSHTSWKQRSSSESTTPQSSNETSVTHATKPSNKYSDPQLSLNLERLPEDKMKPDGLDANNSPMASEPLNVPSVVKDHHETEVRHKRQQTKVHRGTTNAYAPADGKYFQSGTFKRDIVPPVFDPNEPDARNLSNIEIKNSGHGQPKTCWKPKSVHYSHNHQQVDSSNGTQGDGSYGVATDKDIRAQGIENQPLTQKDPTHDINNVGQQEAEVVKVSSGALPKEHTQTPKQGTLSNSGLDQVSAKPHPEKLASPAPRQRGQPIERYYRGPETTYRARDQGQDFVKQNGQTNGERKTINTRYEYQRIDSYNKPSDSFNLNANAGQGAQDVCDTHGRRYRGRGITQPRRGGQYFKRSSGSHNGGE